MSEQWFQINEFPNYEITKSGNIRNKKTKKNKKLVTGKEDTQ